MADNDVQLSLATHDQIFKELIERNTTVVLLCLPKISPNDIRLGLYGDRYRILGILEDTTFDIKTGTIKFRGGQQPNQDDKESDDNGSDSTDSSTG